MASLINLKTSSLTQAKKALKSLNRVNRHFEILRCYNGTVLSVQGSDFNYSTPKRVLANLTSYSALEIMIVKVVTITNLESLKGIDSDGVYGWVPIDKVLELVRDNS